MSEIVPSLWMTAPFIVLLAAIALAQTFFPAWWARRYTIVVFGLAAITLVYYLAVLRAPGEVLQTGMDYLSFMCVVGSLFVVSGGIHIQVKSKAGPAANTVFLLVGAVLANLVGATGACILLIRPWLWMNRRRLAEYHVVFFIFILSNVGAGLMPMGPPLFLGYLEGVPFWWVADKCWPMWLTGLGLLLAMFWGLDVLNRRGANTADPELDSPPPQWRFEGLTNLWFLAVILAAVFAKRPLFLRETLLAAAAVGSYFTTPKSVHESNAFHFHPLREVAVLFAGIFATMMPALDWLRIHAGGFGQPNPTLFYWGSGVLSSVLDNAPTYVSFLNAGFGAFTPADTVPAVLAYVKAHGGDLSALTAAAPHAAQIRQAVMALQSYDPSGLATGNLTGTKVEMALLLANPVGIKCLQALSIGSVFFGANTYIGNGPNFMVKAIAEDQKAPTPTFFGYTLKFAFPFVLPMLVIVWLLFFR